MQLIMGQIETFVPEIKNIEVAALEEFDDKFPFN